MMHSEIIIQKNKLKIALLASFVLLLFSITVFGPFTLIQCTLPANSLQQVENFSLIYQPNGEENNFRFTPDSYTWAG
jgi:hypothetical protein